MAITRGIMENEKGARICNKLGILWDIIFQRVELSQLPQSLSITVDVCSVKLQNVKHQTPSDPVRSRNRSTSTVLVLVVRTRTRTRT